VVECATQLTACGTMYFSLVDLTATNYPRRFYLFTMP
jgi:hypothetical protein